MVAATPAARAATMSSHTPSGTCRCCTLVWDTVYTATMQTAASLADLARLMDSVLGLVTNTEQYDEGENSPQHGI